MKNRFIIILLASAISLPDAADAAQRLSPQSRVTLAVSSRKHNTNAKTRLHASDHPAYIPAIIEISDENAVDSLETLGTVIYRRRGNLLLTSVPYDKVDRLTTFSVVASAEFSPQRSAYVDTAARLSGAKNVIDGNTGTGVSLDGSGIVAGFADTGFDPSHMAFEGKVARLIHYDELTATRTQLDSPDDIAAWTTDNRDESHACHVGNILAGQHTVAGYDGIAPAATLVATTSRLYDVGILAGVEDIIDYAHGTDRPAVVNLSLGSTLGPHDGSDLFCRYLDLCGGEAAICLSAGNNGNSKISLIKTFGDDDAPLGSSLESRRGWDGLAVDGRSEAWSSDSRPMTITFRIYDINERRFVYTSPETGGPDGGDTVIDSESDPELAAFIDGYIMASAGVSPHNGRYTISLAYDYTVSETNVHGPWARYYVCFFVAGAAGATVHVWADGSTSFFQNLRYAGLPDGGSEMSISSMACGHNTICVGAMNSRNSVPLADGNSRNWDFKVGDVASFSSYGSRLNDGSPLPDFCAPGNQVISAMNRYYIESHPESAGLITAVTRGTDRDHYWFYDCGTSMSSPHAAGIFALWLEADPTLTPAQLKEIAVTTARRSVDSASHQARGAGDIDAVAGLKEVLRRAGVSSVTVKPVITVTDRHIKADVPGCDSPVIEVCDIAGHSIDPSATLLPGIYIITVTTPSLRHTSKIYVK